MFGKLRGAEEKRERFWTKCFGERMCGVVRAQVLVRKRKRVRLSVLVLE